MMMIITRTIDLGEALEITVSSMFIVFLILILLAFIVSLFKYIPNIERITKKYNKKPKAEYFSFESMEEDMKVAVLVATVACKSDVKSDVELKSVRKL